MFDGIENELKGMSQEWGKVKEDLYLWLRKWDTKESNFTIENHLIAISNGGGLIAAYDTSESFSKYLKIYSPDLEYVHKILLKLRKPSLNDLEWYEFCEVSYINFTPDELIVVLLANFTLLIFNNIGALVNFSIYKSNDPSMQNLSKPFSARLVSYSLLIFFDNETILYIPDVRKPVWHTSSISKFNQNLSQSFDFIPLNDFSYPLLFYINTDFSITANLGLKSRDIKIPNHKILGLSVSPDFKKIACLMSSSKAKNLFYVLFSDRQFTSSKMKRVLISDQSFSGIPNINNIISKLPNFSDFYWCGKRSILINYIKYCIFVDIEGGACIIENPSTNLVICPEIDGARIICRDGFFNKIMNQNEKNEKKNISRFSFQNGNNFLSIVPEILQIIFKKKRAEYKELCQNYIEWSNGTFKDEIISKFDNESLKKKTESFVEASKMITEKNIQQIFLGTSWFFQSFLDPINRIPTEKDKKVSKTFDFFRILHLLRETVEQEDSKNKPIKKMLITYEQMEFLTFQTIINRLCNRGDHVTAYAISQIVEVEKNPIFNHKALMLIYSYIRKSVNKKVRITDENIEDISNSFDNLDYSQLAMASLKFGNKDVCLKLLIKEKDERKKIPVYLMLGDIGKAFEKAFDYKDQKMINYVAQYAIDHDKEDAVISCYNKTLLPFARFDEYDNQQISLLVFMIKNMTNNAILSYLFSIMKKKLLPPDIISNEIISYLESKNLFHYKSCYEKYIKMLNWINEKGDDRMHSIISTGISTNIRPNVKAQMDLLNKLSINENEQSIVSDTNKIKPIEETVEIQKQVEEQSNSFQFQEKPSESKQTPASIKEQEPEQKSENNQQSESKETEDRIDLTKNVKNKNEESESTKNPDSNPVNDDFSETEQSQSIKKKKKLTKKQKKDENTKETKKVKNKNKDEKSDGTKKVKNKNKDEKSDGTKKVKNKNKDEKSDGTKNVNEKNNNKSNENNEANIKKGDDDNSKKDEIKQDDNADDENKKKKLPIIQFPFLKNKHKSQSENKEKVIEEEEEEKEQNEIEEEEIIEEKISQPIEEIDQLQYNYFPKLRNNVSAMKTIEFELCNGRIEEAKKLAAFINLPEHRFIWLLINFYLRTNAKDSDLLQLCDKIKLIDGLWVVRRCIVLNRLNIAAAFLENISDSNDKYQALIELKKVITSKQQKAPKVDVKNIL